MSTCMFTYWMIMELHSWVQQTAMRGQSSVSRDGLSAGTYYIQVNCGQATSYSISSAYQAPGYANDAEINDSPAQALTLNNNANAEGHIKFHKNGGSTDDSDYYIYTTTQDGNITVNLTNDNNCYAYIYLLDNDGSTILSTTNGYGGAGISFTASGLAEGTYYILVQASSFYAYSFPIPTSHLTPFQMTEPAITFSVLPYRSCKTAAPLGILLIATTATTMTQKTTTPFIQTAIIILPFLFPTTPMGTPISTYMIQTQLPY